MKAITITLELKLANEELLGNSTIGTIRIFNSIPRTFYSLTYNPGRRTDGYNTLDNSTHEADGFYDVITPSIDEATQKLGALFFNTTDFTYPVVALTQPEIDARVEVIADSEAEAVESTRQQDGDAEAKDIFKELRKLLNSGFLTQAQFDLSQDLLFDALLPMTYGLWDVTKTRLDAIVDPVNSELLTVLTEVRLRVDTYIQNN